jgi:hypothetical protein
MGTLPPCALLVLAQLICVAAGDITSAAGGAGLTGELGEYTWSGGSNKEPIRPYTNIIIKREFIFVNRSVKRCITVKFCFKSGADQIFFGIIARLMSFKHPNLRLQD